MGRRVPVLGIIVVQFLTSFSQWEGLYLSPVVRLGVLSLFPIDWGDISLAEENLCEWWYLAVFISFSIWQQWAAVTDRREQQHVAPSRIVTLLMALMSGSLCSTCWFSHSCMGLGYQDFSKCRPRQGQFCVSRAEGIQESWPSRLQSSRGLFEWDWQCFAGEWMYFRSCSLCGYCGFFSSCL